jgi:hypothetical protein
LISFVGFEVLTAVDMKVTIFGDITQCSPLKAKFRRNISPPSSQKENKPSKQNQFATCFHSGFLAYYSTLRMEAMFLRNVG